jgi:hypothetical protein
MLRMASKEAPSSISAVMELLKRDGTETGLYPHVAAAQADIFSLTNSAERIWTPNPPAIKQYNGENAAIYFRPTDGGRDPELPKFSRELTFTFVGGHQNGNLEERQQPEVAERLSRLWASVVYNTVNQSTAFGRILYFDVITEGQFLMDPDVGWETYSSIYEVWIVRQ